MPRRARELTALEVGRLKDTKAVGGVPGLILWFSPRGSRSWILRHSVDGRRRDMGLGPFPEVSLAEARNRAREARSQVRDGVAPIDAKRAAKSSQSARRLASRTFAQVAEAYITSQSPGWKNAKHAGQWLSTLQTYAFPLIG